MTKPPRPTVANVLYFDRPASNSIGMRLKIEIEAGITPGATVKTPFPDGFLQAQSFLAQLRMRDTNTRPFSTARRTEHEPDRSGHGQIRPLEKKGEYAADKRKRQVEMTSTPGGWSGTSCTRAQIRRCHRPIDHQLAHGPLLVFKLTAPGEVITGGSLTCS